MSDNSYSPSPTSKKTETDRGGRFRYSLHEAQATKYRLRFIAPLVQPAILFPLASLCTHRSIYWQYRHRMSTSINLTLLHIGYIIGNLGVRGLSKGVEPLERQT